MGRHIVSRSRLVNGVSVPSFLYGTAWKEERTESLVGLALRCGFRGIDTANQRRHYVEAAVGSAVKARLGEGGLAREELFLQTKFTFAGGQDHRIPYDPKQAPEAQVAQSFESSLEHLGTTYVDSYVLHGPASSYGLTEQDWGAWRAMEDLHRAGKARLIGVSNVSLQQLVLLEREAVVKPSFVQNRCYASAGWDREVRVFCTEKGIVYQGFSLLTANGRALGSPALKSIADRTGRSVTQLAFRFALEVGMIPLTGTSSELHMREDLGIFDFELTEQDVRTIERIAG
jgi:diketogulonate reductase-like aldo/keto reductase